MSRVVPLFLCHLGLAACATTEPGWSGAAATPFASARQTCSEEAGTPADATNPAFVACMERQGWRRGK